MFILDIWLYYHWNFAMNCFGFEIVFFLSNQCSMWYRDSVDLALSLEVSVSYLAHWIYLQKSGLRFNLSMVKLNVNFLIASPSILTLDHVETPINYINTNAVVIALNLGICSATDIFWFCIHRRRYKCLHCFYLSKSKRPFESFCWFWGKYMIEKCVVVWNLQYTRSWGTCDKSF